MASVRDRAGGRCEYCRLPQTATRIRHVVDHVIARQHTGGDDESNLALACQRCNLYKGPNIAGFDAERGTVIPLFHPRRDRWDDHFVAVGERIELKTPTAAVTIVVLNLNAVGRLIVRRELVAEGLWP